MGAFAVGDLFTTKPYIAGAAYIDRMSDYCSGCAFDPKRNCPVTRWYWAFLERHRPQLAGNVRIEMPLRNAASRPAEQREADRACFERARSLLVAGERLTPQNMAEPATP
jgi:deoxyribodipyrimidine photolyase-related protein